MKKLLMSLCVPLLLIGVMISGCKSTDNNVNTVPPADDGTKSVSLEVTGAEFDTQSNIVKTIDVVYPGSVIISLNSNQTTGFSWSAEPVNSNPNVISQYDHNYVAPEATGVVGASGKEVWTFKPKATGTATLTFEYSRPWEGGEKAVRTVQLTITVK